MTVSIFENYWDIDLVKRVIPMENFACQMFGTCSLTPFTLNRKANFRLCLYIEYILCTFEVIAKHTRQKACLMRVLVKCILCQVEITMRIFKILEGQSPTSG